MSMKRLDRRKGQKGKEESIKATNEAGWREKGYPGRKKGYVIWESV